MALNADIVILRSNAPQRFLSRLNSVRRWNRTKLAMQFLFASFHIKLVHQIDNRHRVFRIKVYVHNYLRLEVILINSFR